MIACRVSERGADGRRSRPELREWTRTSRPSGDIKGWKEEAFTNVSVLSDQLSITVPPAQALYRLSFV
jgi:hypothetical protein